MVRAEQQHFSLRFRLRQQVSCPHQVVRRRGKRDHLLHARFAAVPQFPHQANGLYLARSLFHSIPHPLTDRVSFMPRSMFLDRVAA